MCQMAACPILQQHITMLNKSTNLVSFGTSSKFMWLILLFTTGIGITLWTFRSNTNCSQPGGRTNHSCTNKILMDWIAANHNTGNTILRRRLNLFLTPSTVITHTTEFFCYGSSLLKQCPHLLCYYQSTN